MRQALVRLLVPVLVLMAVAGCDEDPLVVPTQLTITGTVSEQGAPETVVAGAEVWFTVETLVDDPHWVETTTDASGAYELQIEAPAGCGATESAEVRYEAEAAGYLPFTSMVLSLTQEVSCDPAPQTFNIAMQPAG
jgi:hypothetical protein